MIQHSCENNRAVKQTWGQVALESGPSLTRPLFPVPVCFGLHWSAPFSSNDILLVFQPEKCILQWKGKLGFIRESLL